MEVQVDVKWWALRQNNSGGYWITDDNVAPWVFIQARNAEEAEQIAERVTVHASEYCECCGERWSTYSFHYEKGTDEPECYGKYYKSYNSMWGEEEARLHYYDGAVGSYKWNSSTTLELDDK